LLRKPRTVSVRLTCIDTVAKSAAQDAKTADAKPMTRPRLRRGSKAVVAASAARVRIAVAEVERHTRKTERAKHAPDTHRARPFLT
jgi:hypothetical protein